MKKLILAAALSIFALSSNATVTVTDNPFYGDIKADHPLFAKGSGGSQSKGLPRTCGQIASCERASKASS